MGRPYNLMNLSGDLEAVLTAFPGALKWQHVGRAIKETWDVLMRGKEGTRDIQAFERRGGFDGTWSNTEVHSYLEELRATIERPGQGALTRAVTAAVWSKGVRMTQWRESVMRYAVFLYLKDRKEADPSWAPRDVFTPKEVTANITDDLDCMAFIARETIGDYQVVGHYRGKLRRHIAGIPFWAWTETLFRRYGNFTRNVYATAAGEGRYGLALGMMMKAWMVFTAIHTWNHMMRELAGCPDANPEGCLMLTVGCDDEGNVYQLRTPGMLSDFLAWWGAPEIVKAVEEVNAGRGDLRDASLDLAFAPASKLVSGVSPFLKVPAEMLLGRTVFPDLRAPRELRDPARHLANVWRLEDVYDVVRGRPSRASRRRPSARARACGAWWRRRTRTPTCCRSCRSAGARGSSRG